MKDIGIVEGSAQQAVPLVIGKNTVYVHTDIEQVNDELWRYHEVQYETNEYLQLAAERASETEQKLQAQAVIAAFSMGAEVQITPEIVELATQGADITEAEDSSEWRVGIRVNVGTILTYNGIAYECTQGHVTLSNWTPDATPALWVVKQPDPVEGETLPWVAGEAVKTGDKRMFEGIVYECITEHTTQAGWTPPNTPSLWKKA
jgi:hypothetical protein